MGQKVSPIGLRVGVIRDWESRWYADKADYGDLLNEDIKIREYLEKNLKDAYISKIEIERTGKKNVTIAIRCARPGAVIGRTRTENTAPAAEGEKPAEVKSNIQKLKEALVKLTGGKNVRINVIAVGNPDLDARLVARRICEQLEARQSFRIAQKKAIQQTMRAGAKGIKTLAKGRLGGAEIARQEGYSRGVVPLHTLRSDIDYACEEAHTTYGKLGVKVWICRGEVLPGQMVKEPEAPANSRGRNDRRNNRRGNNNRRFNNNNRSGNNDRRTQNADAQQTQQAAPAEGGQN